MTTTGDPIRVENVQKIVKRRVREPLDTLAAKVAIERSRRLEEKTQQELQGIRDRMTKIRYLHDVMRAINADRSKDDKLDWSERADRQELLTMLEEMGIEVPNETFKWDSHETRRFIENLKISLQDLNNMNDIQMKIMTKLNNERYEMFQLARTIVRPLQEDKKNKARQFAGR